MHIHKNPWLYDTGLAIQQGEISTISSCHVKQVTQNHIIFKLTWLDLLNGHREPYLFLNLYEHLDKEDAMQTNDIHCQ